MAKEKKAKQPAVDLQKIISEGRDRKKVQDAADKIFGKNRAIGAKKASGTDGSLATRAGVNKQRLNSSTFAARPNSLAARSNDRSAIAPPTGPRADTRAARNAQGLADALFSTKPNPAQAQVNIVPNRSNNGNGATRGATMQFNGAAARGARQQAPRPVGGMTIKGIAGPHVVEVRGFAPGTSAADVEEAMRAKGISVHSCRILQSSPKVIVDILCDSKEDADRIGEFHQQWTDYDSRTGRGFQLFVMESRPAPAPTGFKSQPSQNNGVLVDGSMGFDPLPVDHGNGDSGLYSDQLVKNNTHNNKSNNGPHNNRRGRGFRGGRGGSNR